MIQFPPEKHRRFRGSRFSHSMLVSLAFLAGFLTACGEIATPTPPATVKLTATPTPTAIPTATEIPTPTENPFPYELPPLPGMQGIIPVLLPECDPGIVMGDWTAYYAVVTKDTEERYIIPNPRFLNVNEYASCDMYSIDAPASSTNQLVGNRRALLKVILNLLFAAKQEYDGIINPDAPAGSQLDGYYTTTDMGGTEMDLLPWVMRSQMRGIIRLKDGDQLYFFTTKTRLPEDFFTGLSPNAVFTIIPFEEKKNGRTSVFGLHNKTFGVGQGKVVFNDSENRFEFIPGDSGYSGTVFVDSAEEESWDQSSQ